MKYIVLFTKIFFKALAWLERTAIEKKDREFQNNKRKAAAYERLRSAIRAKRKASEAFDKQWDSYLDPVNKHSKRVRFNKYER